MPSPSMYFGERRLSNSKILCTRSGAKQLYIQRNKDSMYVKEVITHQRKIPSHATVIKKEYVGPLGTATYLLHSDQQIDIEEALPYKVVLLTKMFDHYSISHFTEMLRYFLAARIYCAPTEFIVNRFVYTGTTHIYPMYKSEYIYMCQEERKLAELNPNVLLGLYPVTNDPLCWFNMRCAEPMSWNDTCVVRSSERSTQAQQIYDTIVETSRRRANGDRAEKDPPLLLYTRTI